MGGIRNFLLTGLAAMAGAHFNPFGKAGLTFAFHGPRRPAWHRSARGARYPHSSARQQARYRRQIAAGQLRMEGV